jgi:hypothetical protein
LKGYTQEDKEDRSKMNKIIELMLAIRERRTVFYHKDTKQFDYYPFSEFERRELDPDTLISINDVNNFRLPSYEEINHKEIMRFYVREYVEDKEIRKQLFDILKRNEYVDAYLDKLHELNLHDDFEDVCEDIYIQIFKEWADKNNLDFK